MLLCTDVHLEDGYFDIIQSKGPKSRRIFISDELINYLAEYECQIKMVFPNRTYFFAHTMFKHYDFGFVTCNFRHHFVWANLNSWAKERKDVNAMIPYLAKYMGHQHLSSTLYYFHFVPEFFLPI